jgi:hypothetical protein
MDDLLGTVCRAAGIDPDSGRAEHIAPLVAAAERNAAGQPALRHLLAALIRLDRRSQAREPIARGPLGEVAGG